LTKKVRYHHTCKLFWIQQGGNNSNNALDYIDWRKIIIIFLSVTILRQKCVKKRLQGIFKQSQNWTLNTGDRQCSRKLKLNIHTTMKHNTAHYTYTFYCSSKVHRKNIWPCRIERMTTCGLR